MATYYLSGFLNKGKALYDNVKHSILKPPKELSEMCEALIKTSNKADTKKLNDTNPYFKSNKDQFSAILIVVGFDHKKGAIIEYAYPEKEEKWLQLAECEEFVKSICFVVIPDAIHTLDVMFI